MARNQEDEGRGPWFIISTAIVALVVVAALVLAVVNVVGGGDDEAKESPSTSDSKGSKGESVCGLEPGKSSATTLTSAPKAEWRLIGQTAAPKVEGAGPGKIDPDDQFGSCFARSTTGAVVAAANISTSTASTPALLVKTYKESAVPGPGREKILQAHKDGKLENLTPEGYSTQVAGFHVDRYTKNEATVDVAYELDGPDGQSYGSTPVDLRWLDGDWKIVVNDDGTVFDSQPLDDLSGYVIWSSGA